MADAAQRYGYGQHSHELADTSMTDGAFFEIDTPGSGGDNDPQNNAFSEIDGGSERGSDGVRGLEEGGAMKPWPEIVLRWKRFGMALAASIGLVVGLTILFWIGINVKTLKEPVGDSDESERLLRRYNTYSGVSMGIFEAFLGLGFAQFFPAFTVYVHNLKWWPGDDPSVHTSKAKKVLLLLFFPVVMIAVGNSFSALQAGTSTVGLELFMNASSLGFNRTAADAANKVNFSAAPFVWDHQLTILKSAVLRKSVPFEYVPSNCRKDAVLRSDEVVSGLKRMADVDSTSAVFGFPLKEWSREMYPDQPVVWSNKSLDMQTSFELLFQGQALLERAVGQLPSERCRYFVGNSSSVCGKRKKRTALNDLYGYFNGTKTQSEANLVKEIFAGTQNAFFDDIDQTVNVTFDYNKITISPQIEVQYMSYAVMLEKNFEFGFKGETEVYPKNCTGNACQYRFFLHDSDTFCGQATCVIPDWQADTIPRKQASMMQYKKNCKEDKATFDNDLQTVIPGGCENVDNAVFFMGFGSRIYVDYLAMGMPASGEATMPFAQNPRRAMTITVGKLVWKYENLVKSLDAGCSIKDDNSEACFGLKHKLQPSDRYVLVGKSYMPPAIAVSDFRRPINLFRLMLPKIQSPRVNNAVAIPEYLDRNSLRTTTGTIGVTLAANKCSALADAFIWHTYNNNYHLYGTSQPMYMSALLYIFQHGSVTKIRESQEAASRTRLVGDRAVKRIVIKNTDVGVYTVWIGCIVLLILAFVTLMFPNERARLKPMMGRNARAERFVAVQTEEVYPNLVYMKRFRIGKTGEALKFSEFSVESVNLHHKMEEDEQVFL
ncbi:hypothetical protein PybrP1_004869 [[Pythium] brassicae (nom. inval.)]|nr:hypothetical protein PybrP1_004869 [[Pythium] brassicae (nom. inval.)]